MKRFKLTTGFWEAVVEVNVEDVATMKRIQRSVQFWLDWEDWLDIHEGDYVKAFVSHLGEKLAFLAVGNNREEIIREFEDEEGWLPLDGSQGVRLVECEEYLFDDIQVEEVAP